MTVAAPGPAAAPAPAWPHAAPPRRVLLIKPSSLGDVVHALPVLNLMRRRWPAAHIAWVVAPYCAGLLAGLPQLDRIILFQRRRLGSAWRSPSALRELAGFLADLRNGDFDLVVDLQGLFRSGMMAYLTGADARVGFAAAREGAPAFYTHAVEVPTPEMHAVDRYLRVARALGCDVDLSRGAGPELFTFPVRDEHRAHVRSLLPPGRRYAVLMPGTNWLTKRWLAESFAELAERLPQRLGLTPVLAGGGDAAELAARIPAAVNLAGRTDLPQLVALLEGADLVVANDSGPMHIAAALGRPLLALFGPTNPVRTGPYRRPEAVLRLDMPCSPCYSRRCSHMSCLAWLTAEQVLRAAEAALAIL